MFDIPRYIFICSNIVPAITLTTQPDDESIDSSNDGGNDSTTGGWRFTKRVLLGSALGMEILVCSYAMAALFYRFASASAIILLLLSIMYCYFSLLSSLSTPS